jgi:hypothetical protein
MKYGIWRKMGRTGCNHVQQRKPCSEGQTSHVLSYAESIPKTHREIYMHIYITMTIIEGMSKEGNEAERKERK